MAGTKKKLNGFMVLMQKYRKMYPVGKYPFGKAAKEASKEWKKMKKGTKKMRGGGVVCKKSSENPDGDAPLTINPECPPGYIPKKDEEQGQKIGEEQGQKIDNEFEDDELKEDDGHEGGANRRRNSAKKSCSRGGRKSAKKCKK